MHTPISIRSPTKTTNPTQLDQPTDQPTNQAANPALPLSVCLSVFLSRPALSCLAQLCPSLSCPILILVLVLVLVRVQTQVQALVLSCPGMSYRVVQCSAVYYCVVWCGVWCVACCRGVWCGVRHVVWLGVVWDGVSDFPGFHLFRVFEVSVRMHRPVVFACLLVC